MINDPYGLNKRGATIEGLQAEIIEQHKTGRDAAKRDYSEGLHQGRTEQLYSQELRKWCINILVEKGKITDAQTLIDGANEMEQFILGETNNDPK